MTCLAILAVTAAMVVDGDTVRIDGALARLTRQGNAAFDTPETWRPWCEEEAARGAQATDALRQLMPGQLCIIGRGNGGYGRDLAVLYDRQGRDVGAVLLDARLAQESINADWCADG